MANGNGKKIPIVYLVYLHRFNHYAFKQKLSLGQARSILTFYFRIPHQRVTTVIGEMQEHGLLNIEGQRFVVLEENCKQLIANLI